MTNRKQREEFHRVLSKNSSFLIMKTSRDADLAFLLHRKFLATELQHIKISNCEITNTGLVYLSLGCPGLQHIDISHCCNITDAGLVILAQDCPRLQHIDISRCHKITDVGIALLSQA